jgi:hypothetical protein
MRWLVCPSCLVFLKSFYNILDLAVVIPFVVRAYLYFATDLSAEVLQAGESFIVCTVPVMRLIKALKAQHNFTLLVVTLNAVWEPLMVPFFMLLITCLSSSSLLFVFEPRDNIPSVPNAMWLVALTVSTVGYGDVYPVTDVGRLIIIQVIFVGVLCMAMPISIVGAAFTETWRSRTKIIILRRIRSRLLEWEYGEEDLRLMFNAFDASKAGELDFQGFEAVIAEMRLGLDTGQVGRLFDLFDADGSGSVDCDEFLEGIGLQDPHKNEGDVF